MLDLYDHWLSLKISKTSDYEDRFGNIIPDLYCQMYRGTALWSGH